MPDLVFELDPERRFDDQRVPGHNRWHPEIPPVAMLRPGQTARIECRAWFDGSIRNDDSAADVLHAPFSTGHPLSGPFAVAGARPGDLLVVDILDVAPAAEGTLGPLAGMGWGYTGIFAPNNGGSFLREHFPDAAYKAVWEFDGGIARSRHIPGVAIPAMPHPGVMGTAPSAQLLRRWNVREARLLARNPLRVPPLALPPLSKDALLGGVPKAAWPRIAAEAAQTAPPRENGGNQDIKHLTRGSRAFYPVFVDGANLSVGDLHYSQGDGEITFCGAIEMGGHIDVHVDLIPAGMDTYGIREHPVFVPGDPGVTYDRWLSFSGTSVTLDDRQRYLDPSLAYQRACLHAIDYLTTFGYSREQAYLLLGAAPVEGRLSSVVDFPNACATVSIPTAIFDVDLLPSASGPARVSPGTPVPRADAADLPKDSTLRAVPKDKRVLVEPARHLLRHGLQALGRRPRRVGR